MQIKGPYFGCLQSFNSSISHLLLLKFIFLSFRSYPTFSYLQTSYLPFRSWAFFGFFSLFPHSPAALLHPHPSTPSPLLPAFILSWFCILTPSSVENYSSGFPLNLEDSLGHILDSKQSYSVKTVTVRFDPYQREHFARNKQSEGEIKLVQTPKNLM